MSEKKVYIRRVEFVEAVQWLGLEKGPHDLGISKTGFLDGTVVQPGDWLVWEIVSYRGVRLTCTHRKMRPEAFATEYSVVPGTEKDDGHRVIS